MFLQRWGATESEIAAPVVGDDLVADARLVATRSIDLASPARQAWPWLVQMGFGRGGWYSCDWLDDLGRPNATRIHAEWRHLVAGSSVPAGPIAFRAAVVDAPHALVLEHRSTGSIGRRVAFTHSSAFEPTTVATANRTPWR